MSDDPLLDALGVNMQKQDSALDAQLEKLAHGTLTPQERAALDARIAEDPEVASQAAMFAKLSPSVQSKLKDIAVKSLSAEAEAEAEEVQPAAPVHHIFRRNIVGASAAVLTLPAATVLYVRAAPEVVAPIPNYALQARAGDVPFRSDPAAATSNKLRADSEIQIVVSPEVDVDGDVDGRLYVRIGDQIRPSSAKPEVSPSGAVRWVGRADELAGTDSGTVVLIAVVGRSDAVARAGPAPGPASGSGWQAVAVEVVIRPLAGP